MVFTGNIVMCWVYELIGIVFYLPFAECELDITSNHDYAIINGFAYAGLALSFFFWGFLADTKGRRRVMLPALIMSLVFTLFSSFSQSYWFYTICRFFNGFLWVLNFQFQEQSSLNILYFSVGSAASVGIVYMSEFFCDEHRSLSIIVAYFIDGFIGVLMPLCGYFIVNMDWEFHIPILDMVYKPWRLFILFLGLPSFITVLVLIFWLPESPKFMYNRVSSWEVSIYNFF